MKKIIWLWVVLVNISGFVSGLSASEKLIANQLEAHANNLQDINSHSKAEIMVLATHHFSKYL